MIALSIVAAALAVPATAWILRSTILAYERIRIEGAAARWDARVADALAKLEGEGARLEAVERMAREARDTAQRTSNKVAARR